MLLLLLLLLMLYVLERPPTCRPCRRLKGRGEGKRVNMSHMPGPWKQNPALTPCPPASLSLLVVFVVLLAQAGQGGPRRGGQEARPVTPRHHHPSFMWWQPGQCTAASARQAPAAAAAGQGRHPAQGCCCHGYIALCVFVCGGREGGMVRGLEMILSCRGRYLCPRKGLAS